MAIAREDLKKLGFKQFEPVSPPAPHQWDHEVWYHEKYEVWVGYNQEGVKHPVILWDGDKYNLTDVCLEMVGNVESAWAEAEAGDDW